MVFHRQSRSQAAEFIVAFMFITANTQNLSECGSQARLHPIGKVLAQMQPISKLMVSMSRSLGQNNVIFVLEFAHEYHSAREARVKWKNNERRTENGIIYLEGSGRRKGVLE